MRPRSNIFYCIALLLFTSTVFLFLHLILPEPRKHDKKSVMNKSWEKMRKVKNHFYFGILSSYDSPLFEHDRYIPYINRSDFNDIMERILLSKYLENRFEYSTFIQFTCQGSHNIYEHLLKMKKSVCVNVNENFKEYLEVMHSQFKVYDMIVLDPAYFTESQVVDSLLLLAEGGVLMLTDSNIIEKNSDTAILQEISSLQSTYILSILSLRSRYDLDIATLDVDGGITLIFKRRNSNHLEYGTTKAQLMYPPEASPSNSSEVKTDNFINKMKNENEKKNENENENLIYISNEINMKILNLMTFEDLHNWLAPSGHVDALTAFGGLKALNIFRESEAMELKCSRILVDSSPSEALTCLQEAHVNGRLSLKSRWLLYLLYIQIHTYVHIYRRISAMKQMHIYTH
mmetsp:Transcript_23100/g.22252  ORF Transcript_23100/g.22252 Transcript_23100/m.22252 type:complete len:402 (+) Transcript_23100:271-1476(+)